jgi:hypothetical protein
MSSTHYECDNRKALADIKLFQLHADSARELRAESVDIEKSLQSLMEQHLESFLGVRFLATEYVTGKTYYVTYTVQ